ncbi:MAG: transcription termination/antitermination protein NusA [Legionellales bacterium]|nr:MAG: transcription termination/antitermination protein NusA [Legionellales bacterium]
MSNELPLKAIIGAVSMEKGVSETVIFAALEAALVSATKKKDSWATANVQVTIDKAIGSYETTRIWEVVADDTNTIFIDGLEIDLDPEVYLHLSAAKEINPDAIVGEPLVQSIESVAFGRIAAQTAKQVIIQKVKEAERALVSKEYEKKIGQLITGTVKKVTRDFVIVDVANNVDGMLRRDQMLPRDAFRARDRIRAYLTEVSPERGPQLVLSRVCDEMLIELFKLEVPEVDEGIIEIRAAARDPGSRAKIAVKTNDGRVDPVGACVGVRGSRVQAVSNELDGERIDIVLWDGDPAQFAMSAMAPAEVLSIMVDEESMSMDIAVSEDSLAQAIGRNGQNVKLASKITGWLLNVMSDVQATEATEAAVAKLQQVFIDELNVDPEVALLLAAAGFSSVEEVAYVPKHELLEIEEFDAEIVDALRSQAKDILVTKALTADADSTGNTKPVKDSLALETLEGINDALLAQLAAHQVKSRDDLAEYSVEELLEIVDTLDESQAVALIMAAKAHWFVDE